MVQELKIDDDDDDEFEPLFSYERVCRPPSDDDSDDDVAVLDQKGVGKRTGSQAWSSAVGHENLIKETEDDDDWLPPPPKSAKIFDESKVSEDPTLREIRQAREDWMRLAESRVQENNASQKYESQMQEGVGEAQEEHGSASVNREKVLLSIQSKDGTCKGFRIFKDEKFGKLFSKYAELVGVEPQQLVFFFDGGKILEHNTPKDFDMEDEDIVEANIKK